MLEPAVSLFQCAIVSVLLRLCTSGDKMSRHIFVNRCLIYLYVVLNAEYVSKKDLHIGSVVIPRIIQTHLSLDDK
jgi:hypothetical protein